MEVKELRAATATDAVSQEQVFTLIRQLSQPVEYIGTKFSSNTLEEILRADILTLVSDETLPANSLYKQLYQLLTVGFPDNTVKTGEKKPKAITEKKTKVESEKKGVKRSKSKKKEKTTSTDKKAKQTSKSDTDDQSRVSLQRGASDESKKRPQKTVKQKLTGLETLKETAQEKKSVQVKKAQKKAAGKVKKMRKALVTVSTAQSAE